MLMEPVRFEMLLGGDIKLSMDCSLQRKILAKVFAPEKRLSISDRACMRNTLDVHLIVHHGETRLPSTISEAYDTKTIEPFMVKPRSSGVTSPLYA